VLRGNPVALEQFLGFAAARDLADGEAMDRESLVGNRRRHGVADSTDGIVILDGDQMSAGGARGGDQPVAIDRRDGVEIDHADRHAAGLQLVVRLQRLNTVTPPPITVATSLPLSRSTFSPPIVNVSSFE
jgi:hypothetical protein